MPIDYQKEQLESIRSETSADLIELHARKRDGVASIYEGFTFHMLRHTAASLMARAGYTAAAAAERLEHGDGGALFHGTYRHLFEDEKRSNANRLELLVREELDENDTEDGEEGPEGLNHADSEDGRYWARTSDPQLVERGLESLRALAQAAWLSQILPV